MPSAALSENRRKTALAVLLIGALWGIFEATAGYLLHLLPVPAGWLVWYPAACFFMAMAYLRTKKASAIVLVGLLSASVKLLNLLMPVRMDRVLNPAVSIVLEALAMLCAVLVLRRVAAGHRTKPLARVLAVICMNTGWRVLYMLYILLIVPQWMRDISVISSQEHLINFFVIENAATSAVLFFGSLAAAPVRRIWRRFAQAMRSSVPVPACMKGSGLQIVGTALLLCACAALQMLL